MAIVTLTEQELRLADVVGRQRQDEDVAAGYQRGGAFIGFEGSPYEQEALGVCGEIAFARFLGIKFVPTKMKEVDVGGYEVRTGSEPNYSLIIRPRDVEKGGKFALVVRLERVLYRIVGWIEAEEGKAVGERKNPKKGKNAGPAWFVAQKDLRNFSRQLEWGGK